MKRFVQNAIAFLVLASTTACTYNVSMAHTQGSANDVIDDNASNTPSFDADVDLPLVP